MSAFGERRQQDLVKLQELAAGSNGRIKIIRSAGNPLNFLELALHYRTAPSEQYPRTVQDVTTVKIELPARYPFAEPTATIVTPIFHPNVYSGGRICFGVKWLASEGLDLLVQRVIQIITFDPLILNEKSPANGAALSWYRTARSSGAQFPTDSVKAATAPQKPTMKWSEMAQPATKTLVLCPGCGAKLALPSGKTGRVNCPKCHHGFEAIT